MAIDPVYVCETVKDHGNHLKAQQKTLDIYENNLMKYVDQALARQLSERSYRMACERMVPINIYPKVIDKLSNIYQQGVVREVMDGTQSDTDLMNWYVKQMYMNETMHHSNTIFNACKSTLIHPFFDDKYGPRLRVIPNDRFIVESDDPVDPLRVTRVTLLAGKRDQKEIYWVYTDTEFAIVTSDQKIDYAAMAMMGNPDGINPYGQIPFVYVNSSALKLTPSPDYDGIRMTEVIPVMLADLNLAAMFQSFSIMYGVDLSIENMTYAPNTFWFLKSDNPGESKPEIGTIKPEVDFQEVLNLIQSQLSMWLGTRGIRANGVGELTQQNFASGISKVIDEMDTLDARQAQTSTFSCAEKDLWALILEKMHPMWVDQGKISQRALWTPGASVLTSFRLAIPGTTRTQLIDEQQKEYAAGFTTRRRAIQALNPTFTEADVDALLLEITEERYGSAPEPEQVQLIEAQTVTAEEDYGSTMAAS